MKYVGYSIFFTIVSMRIIFNTYFREKTGGGIGQVACEISRVFAEDHQVLFIIPGDKTKVRKEGNLTFLEIKSVGNNQMVLPKLIPKSVKYIVNKLNKFHPDLIHVHDPGPMAFFLQNWAIKNNIPFLQTSHILPTKFIEFGSQNSNNKLNESIYKLITKKYLLPFYNNCSGVVALNKNALRDIKKLGYRGKIFEIPNGRHLDDYNQLPLADISSPAKHLLFIGFFSSRKNQLFLLKAMDHLPKNFCLDLIGIPLQEKYGKNLSSFVKKNNLNVNFVGQIDHAQIPVFLQKAHFFVSASKMEVQSLVIMESMASGTPVIGLSNETTDQFVNNENGFCFPKKTSPYDFAAKIIELSNLSKNDYEKLCLNARKQMEPYDWEKIKIKTEKMYEDVIADKKISERLQKKKKTNTVKNKDLYAFLLVIITLIAAGYSFDTEIKKLLSKSNSFLGILNN